jgi:hypothetical protein
MTEPRFFMLFDYNIHRAAVFIKAGKLPLEE